MSEIIKIGFYFKNNKYENIDFSSPQNGNPGVGGVEYMFSLVSYYLASYYEIYVLTNVINNFSNKTINITVNSFEDALKRSDELGLDYLVCRSFGNKEDYELLKKYNTNIIIWSHNFSKYKELNWISKCNKVVKYVCVGKHQYELLNGHPVYKKATYIFNGLPLDVYKTDNANISNSICYVGSIIKGKGFDTCCKVWRRLYDNGYDIGFNVIGSAKLYNSSKKLGKFGIASADYENEFVDYITENGRLIEKVKLYGVLGHKEKIDVINKSYLGLSASKEETFGLIALEFALLGKPFAGKQICGYKDIVVNNRTGFLVNSEDELYEKCVKILTMSETEYKDMSDLCIQNSKCFDIKTIVNDWNRLFLGLTKNEDLLKRNHSVSCLRKIFNICYLLVNYH